MERCQNAWEGFADDLASLLEQGKSQKPDADVMIALVDSMKMRVKNEEDFALPAGDGFEVLVEFLEHFAQHPHNYVLKPLVPVIESLADKCIAAEFAIAWDFLNNLVQHAKSERDMIAGTVDELACLVDLPDWELPIPAKVHQVWPVLRSELEDAGIAPDLLEAMSTALDTNRAQVELLDAAVDVYLQSTGHQSSEQQPVSVEVEMLRFMDASGPIPWATTMEYLQASEDIYCDSCTAGQLITWLSFMAVWNPEEQEACPHTGYSREMNTNLLAHNLHLLQQALQEGSDSKVVAFILGETFCSLNQQNPQPASIHNKLVRSGFSGLQDFHERSPQTSHALVGILLSEFHNITAAYEAVRVDPNDWT